MYYLTLAMHNINVSQVPGGSFSHPNGAMDLCGVDKGVDFFYCRTGYMKCIGQWLKGYNTYMFQPCDQNGNPVKVLCADGIGRIVTIAMTHSNRRYVKTKVGKIYKQDEPIYEEGTMGKATGNHIHIEVAKGTVKTKYYDPNMKVYRMKGEMSPAKMFWIDDSFSKIIDTHGLNFKICHKAELETVEKPASTIAYGYNRYTKNGISALTFRAKAKDGYSLHLISAGEVTSLLPIAHFDSSKIIKSAVLNCNYFDLKNGTHYGVEQDGLIQGYHQEPKTSGLLVYYVDKESKSFCVPSDQYWMNQNDVQVAFTPYAITVLNGVDVNLRSINLADKKDRCGTQSAVAKMANGEFVLAAFDDCYPRNVREFFQSFKDDDVQDVCILDSGGSTQMRVWTKGKMQTVVSGDKRRLPNVLCLAKKNK